MIYLPIKQLQPGMVLARDVSSDSSFFALLTSGQQLTSESILKLARYGVWGAYIESSVCQDIVPEDTIDREFRRRAVGDIKRIYDSYSRQKTVSSMMVKNVADLAEQLLNQVLSREELLLSVIDIKEHDTYTYTHSMYVGILSVLLGIELGYARPALAELAVCGLLHDIGKLEIPLEIINKPSRLTADEFELMKSHPSKAIDRLYGTYQLSARVLSGISTHHEKFDGTGYPRSLSGKNIPIYGRILALADVYDSLTSNRPYRLAWSSSDAIEYMMSCADSHFDTDLLQAFLRTVCAYPAGTLVELNDGRTAVVLRTVPDNVLRPAVRLLSPDDQQGVELDLANDPTCLSVTISSVFGGDKVPDALLNRVSQ